jgi:hypothetical protein
VGGALILVSLIAYVMVELNMRRERRSRSIWYGRAY